VVAQKVRFIFPAITVGPTKDEVSSGGSLLGNMFHLWSLIYAGCGQLWLGLDYHHTNL
jgi:hypothetical protein